MQRILKLFSLGILFFQLQFVYADCSDQEIKDLKKMAEAVQIDMEFDRESLQYGIYNNNIVTIQNLPDDLYIMSKDYSIGIFPEDAVNGVITKNLSSNTDVFQIYSITCPSTVFRTIKLSMKQYNEYADYEECDGIDGDELDVCDEFYKTNISYEKFVEKVNEYKNKKINISDKVKEGFEYYYPIIIGITIILIIIIVIGIVRNRKRSKLD